MAAARIDNALGWCVTNNHIHCQRPCTAAEHWASVRRNVRNWWVIRVGVSVVRRTRPGLCAEDFDTAVVKWQHAKSFGFAPPQRNHFLQFFGMGRRQVMHFRKILIEFVQTPQIFVVWHSLIVERNCLKTIGPDCAMAHHLEVLRAALGCAACIAKRVRKALTMHRHLLMAINN